MYLACLSTRLTATSSCLMQRALLAVLHSRNVYWKTVCFSLRDLPLRRRWLALIRHVSARIDAIENSLCLAAGAWSLSQAADLTWAEGDNWHTTVDLPSGSLVEYKYVILDGAGQAVAWQSGNNSVLAVKHSEDELEVFDSWCLHPCPDNSLNQILP